MFSTYSPVETAEGTIGLFEPITPCEPETPPVTLPSMTELLQGRYVVNQRLSSSKLLHLTNPQKQISILWKSPTDFIGGSSQSSEEPETPATLIPVSELFQRGYSADSEKSRNGEVYLVNPKKNTVLIYRSPTDFEAGAQRQHCFLGHRREI